MTRTSGISLIVTAIACGAIYALRDLPSQEHRFAADTAPEKLPFDWPPRVGTKYPDLKLVDHTGKTTRLSEFRGKIILVELIGIPCGACQAFAGAHEVGAFRGGKVQSDLESIEACARRYGHFNLNDRRVVYVQLLLFNESIQAPSSDDARAWATHFGMGRSRNQIVLVGNNALASRQSYGMIPGFHLIDRDFVLRRDSCGHQPIHDLYADLLPTMGALVNGKR